MINKVIITGRLVNDTKVFNSTFNAGDIWAVNTIVYNENYKDNQGQWQSKAHFFPVSSSHTRVAKKMSYVAKGKLVTIEGRLVMKEKANPNDPNGPKVKDISIVVEDINLTETIKTEGEVPTSTPGATPNYNPAPAAFPAPTPGYAPNMPVAPGFVAPAAPAFPSAPVAPAPTYTPPAAPAMTVPNPMAAPVAPAAPAGLPPMSNPAFTAPATPPVQPVAPAAPATPPGFPSAPVAPGLSFSDPTLNTPPAVAPMFADNGDPEEEFDVGGIDVSTFELDD